MAHCIRFYHFIANIYLYASLLLVATNEKKRLIITHAYYRIILFLTET